MTISLFIKYDEMINDDVKYIEDDNMLLVKGKEIYSGESIYIKTLKALIFCNKNFNYEYIVRTNISSFWNLNNLCYFLHKINLKNTLFGHRAKTYYKNRKKYFISGTGIFMHFNLVQLILNHKQVKYPTHLDDYEITQFYKDNNIQIKFIDENNFIHIFEFDNEIKITEALENLNN